MNKIVPFLFVFCEIALFFSSLACLVTQETYWGLAGFALLIFYHRDFIQKHRRLLLGFFGTVLLIDSIILMLYRNFGFGIYLPFLLGIIFLIHARFLPQILTILKRHRYWHLIWKSLWIIFAFWLISLVLFFAQLTHLMQQPKKQQPVQAIIILGSGIRGDQPTPTLAKRLDEGAVVAQQNPQAKIIVSGGVGVGKKYSEAEIMSRYLQQHYAIDSSRILQEGQSTSTELNLQNSKPILARQHISLQQPIAIVTSDFHLPRTAAIAKKQGYQNMVLYHAPTPLSIRYNSWLREYFAYLSGWLLREF